MNRLVQPEKIDEYKLWSLLAVLLAIFLLYPAAAYLDIVRFYQLVLVLALGQATYAVSGSRTVRRIALALVFPAIIGQIVATSLPGIRSFVLVAYALSITFFAFVIASILKSVFRPGEITADRIAGAICIYLLAGLLWATLYSGILLADPAAFNMTDSVRQVATQGGAMPLLYFSFVTLTTLGFGDISPVSPLAQTVTWLQAVTGQLYIAILLGRLVSLHVASKTRRAADQEPE